MKLIESNGNQVTARFIQYGEPHVLFFLLNKFLKPRDGKDRFFSSYRDHIDRLRGLPCSRSVCSNERYYWYSDMESATNWAGGVFHDAAGRPVVDFVIPEPASEQTVEPPATVMSQDVQGNLFDVELNVAHGLPNNSDVFLNTTGTVYLLEPGSATQVSDIVTLSFTPDPNAFFS